jgi:membrane protein required for colicin V production
VSGADWIIVVVILVSVLQAASSGFFQELFSIAGLVLGYLIAAWQYRRLAAWFAPNLNAPWLGDIGAFLIIFLGVMIVAGIAGRISRWIMKEVGLKVVDRLLGAALGLVRGGLTVAIVLMSMAAFAPTSKWLEGSSLAPYFLVFGRAAVWVAPAEMRARFFQGLDLLRRTQPAATGRG